MYEIFVDDGHTEVYVEFEFLEDAWQHLFLLVKQWESGPCEIHLSDLNKQKSLRIIKIVKDGLNE